MAKETLEVAMLMVKRTLNAVMIMFSCVDNRVAFKEPNPTRAKHPIAVVAVCTVVRSHGNLAYTFVSSHISSLEGEIRT